MRPRSRLILALPLLLGRSAAAEPAPPVPNEAELKQGKTVFGPDETGYLLIRAPLDEVWRRLADIPHWPAIFGDLKSVRLVGKAGKFTEYAFVADTPIGKKRYTLAFSQPRPYRLDFVLDKTQPADLNDATGMWELRPAEGGITLAIYRGRYETSFPFPGFLRRRVVESMLTDLRTYMDRHPPAPPAPPPAAQTPPSGAAKSPAAK
jgi:hypothetical protein